MNEIHTRKKVDPFNSMHDLNKDLNQDCHISTAHTHTHSRAHTHTYTQTHFKSANKENALTFIDQIKLLQFLSNVNSA